MSSVVSPLRAVSTTSVTTYFSGNFYTIFRLEHSYMKISKVTEAENGNASTDPIHTDEDSCLIKHYITKSMYKLLQDASLNT